SPRSMLCIESALSRERERGYFAARCRYSLSPHPEEARSAVSKDGGEYGTCLHPSTRLVASLRVRLRMRVLEDQDSRVPGFGRQHGRLDAELAQAALVFRFRR